MRWASSRGSSRGENRLAWGAQPPRRGGAADVPPGIRMVADKVEALAFDHLVRDPPVANFGRAVATRLDVLVEKVNELRNVARAQLLQACHVEGLVDPAHVVLADRVAEA